ncbi:MAG: hypothetical protein OEY93_06495 [Anaerolineae bacterium]|nr:hypothetical protein [Anaerolineae bacterium]
MKNNPREIKEFKLGLLALLGLSAAAVFQFGQQIHLKGPVKPLTKFWVVERAGWIMVGLLVVITVAVFLGGASRIFAAAQSIKSQLQKQSKLQRPILVILLFAYPLAAGFAGKYLENPFPRWWLFAVLSGAGYIFISAIRGKSPRQENWLVTLLVFTASFFLATFVHQVSSYPLSLDWSEASRYYHASLYFDRAIYGINLPLPHRDFSRYFIQSLPFLVPGSSIWLHRLWQAVLRAGLPLICGWLLAKRFKHHNTARKWIFVLWAAFFILQGPVFYPMLVIVAIMLWGFDSQNLARSTLVVFLASLLAGVTRINWIPMPAMMASVIFIIEQPIRNRKIGSIARYFFYPALWTLIGLGLGLGVQWLYEANSGLAPSMFSTSFSSDLLWYRLLPNSSYRYGILLNLAFVCGPFAVLVWRVGRDLVRQWDVLRRLALGAILLVFLLGGLVVSVKIGGGTNLHNLDGFLILLLLAGVYIYFEADGEQAIRAGGKSPAYLFAIVLLLPIYYLVANQRALAMPEFDGISETMEKISVHTGNAHNQGKEILFLAERQLITFNSLEDVLPLVHDYEKLVLMEMVTGRNEEYLRAFEADMRSQRFGLIITDKLARDYKIVGVDSLAEENNIFIDRVLLPLWCNYESVQWVRKGSIELWAPRETPLVNCHLSTQP